jgi:hypothetical protein
VYSRVYVENILLFASLFCQILESVITVTYVLLPSPAAMCHFNLW